VSKYHLTSPGIIMPMLFVCTKSAQLLGFVCINLSYCTPKVKYQAFKSHIRPIMIHGTPGWHPVTDRNVNKLQRIQNSASKFIYGKNCSHELDKNILPVKSLLQYIDLIYSYLCRNNLIDCAVTGSMRTGRAIRGEDGVKQTNF
jgi:hypothetical protein